MDKGMERLSAEGMEPVGWRRVEGDETEGEEVPQALAFMGPFEAGLIRDGEKRPLVMVWLPVDAVLLAHILEQAPKGATVEGFRVRSLVSEVR